MNEAITLLRQEMKKAGVDVYLVPTDDFHQSEYVGEYFRAIRFLSGFTGEGSLVVTMDEAKLFTDGRYFIQAAGELAGSGVELMKMGEPGVPTLDDYIKSVVPEGGFLGFDGRCVDFRHGMELRDLLSEKAAAIVSDKDLVGRIWKDRPALAESRVFILEDRFCGVNAKDKLTKLRAVMAKEGADIHLISSLDDIAWLLNLRGDDIPCNPVFLSYLLVDMEGAYLFANKNDFDEEIKAYLKALHIQLCDYDKVYETVQQLRNKTVLLETGKTNYQLIMALDESMMVVDEMLPTSIWKSQKNETEIANMKKAHIKDGVAVTKYFYFMKHAFGPDGTLTKEARETLGTDRLTEVSGADLLERYRRENDGFIELSFNTISAYGPNAALPHYAPVRGKQDAEILPKGLYLVDSGAQYFEGTTDITRTMAMGPITEEERKHFTMVAQACLRLGDVRILDGSCGVSFDYAAREIFWKEGLNFNHGTGHGVGFCLNVHERPNGVRYRIVPERQDSAPFKPGNITSDEPGLYIEGSHGIRTENLTLCKEALKNEYGTFYDFEFLTLCPIDLDAIDPTIMAPHDIELLNRYHATVYEKLSPYFEGEKLEWLKHVTRAI
ncbi:MAG TPA: peptidase M24 [Oribacterium sp.]|jgi:Xaa-Pro aminopeptidase|nr:peptidase M24 [Oribacterium sp.]